MEVAPTDIPDADARQKARKLIASVAHMLGNASGYTLYDIWGVLPTLGLCVALFIGVRLFVYLLRTDPAVNRPRSSVTLAPLRTKSDNDESSDNGLTRLTDQRTCVNTTPEIYVGAHECIPCDEVETMYGWGIRMMTAGGKSRGQALVRLEASSTWLWWLFLVLAIVYAVTAILLWVFANSANVNSCVICLSFFSFTGSSALTPSVLFTFKLRFWHPIGAALAAVFYAVIVFGGVERISNSVLNRAIAYGFWWYAFFALLFFQAMTILALNFTQFYEFFLISLDHLFISAFAIAGLTFLYMIIIDQVAKYHGPSFVAWIMWIGSLIITLGFSAMLGAYFFDAESQTPGWITALTWIFIVWLILGYCLYMLLYMLQVGALKDFRVHLWVLTLMVFVWSMIFYWTLFAKQ